MDQTSSKRMISRISWNWMCIGNCETSWITRINWTILGLLRYSLENLAQFPTATLSLFQHIVVARATVRGREKCGLPLRRNSDALKKCRTTDTFFVTSKQASLFRRFPIRHSFDPCKLSHFRRNVVRRFECRSSDFCKLS